MGGPGSGRPRSFSAKRTVEDCRSLRISTIAADGCLDEIFASGKVTWTRVITGEETASLDFRVDWERGVGRFLHLDYTVTVCGETQDVHEAVGLTTTRPHFGGVRWWFLCPLAVAGRPCNRRVGKLYLPPGCRYFGCRHCYDLTYTSAQEAHKSDALHRMIAADMGVDPLLFCLVMKYHSLHR